MRRSLAAVAAAIFLAQPISAQESLALVTRKVGTSGNAGEVHVVDVDANALLGILPISSICKSVAILGDGSRAFVPVSLNRIGVFDLTTNPIAQVASIPISGQTMAVSPDQRTLIVAEAILTFSPVYVVDVETLTVRSSQNPGMTDTGSPAISYTGSVMLLNTELEMVGRFQLDALGNLNWTRELFFPPDLPLDLAMSPDGRHTTVASDGGVTDVLAIPGLARTDSVVLPGRALYSARYCATVFAPEGDALYGLLWSSRAATVSRLAFDATTGDLADIPEWVAETRTGTSTCLFLRPIAVHPDGHRLYHACSPQGVGVRDTKSGELLDELLVPDAVTVVVSRRPALFLLTGVGPGSAEFGGGRHTWTTQLRDIQSSQRLELGESVGLGSQAAPIASPIAPTVVDEFDVQAVMWNPVMFPVNREQWSAVLHVQRWSHGGVTAETRGTSNGITLELARTHVPGAGWTQSIVVHVAGL